MLLRFVVFLPGLQSHCKSTVLLAQSSPPSQHHFCYGKTQVQQKEGKWNAYASLTGTQPALTWTHKYTATLQLKFAALFLTLKWNTLTAHAIEGETGLHHPFLFTSDQTKASSGHRQSKQSPQAVEQQCCWCAFASSWIEKSLDVAFSNSKTQKHKKDPASRPSCSCKKSAAATLFCPDHSLWCSDIQFCLPCWDSS